MRIGIIGGGQLARMMVAPAIGLGLRLSLLAEGPNVSAAKVVPDTTIGDYTDLDTVMAFASGVDVVTFDHEHVPQPILQQLVAAGIHVRPGPAALQYAQDKAAMRQRLSGDQEHSVAYQVVSTPAQLTQFAAANGWPIIAKASRGGYDGKGVWKLDGPDDAAQPFASLAPGVQIVAEEFVFFKRELSVLVARSANGDAVAYPVSESVQRNGVCLETITPAPGLSPEAAEDCAALALDLADDLDVIGILAVELMEHSDGRIVINELAMRPHNTGHWSVAGAVTSQFENHLRAVAGLPLGDAAANDPYIAMVNVFGGTRSNLVTGLDAVLADPDLSVQLYGKQVLPGRKVGHVTVFGDDPDDVRARARAAAATLSNVGGA